MLTKQPVNYDEVELHIDNAVIRVKRYLTYDLPHEVTAVIPRAEIRRRKFENGQLTWEEEIILNSLTVVHSPQRPSKERYKASHPKPTSNTISGSGSTYPQNGSEKVRLRLTYS
ncbi:MAG: hypothetical protein PWP31_447 [Clostridia bacterium]|nr:hypothetical protein [Clostridia bacterium]